MRRGVTRTLKTYSQSRKLYSLKPTLEPEQRTLKGMIQKYGVVALITYNMFGLTSLSICFTAVHFGLDTGPFISLVKEYAPFLMSSNNDTGTHSKLVTEFILAYAVHKVMFPVRVALTISTVPLMARKFNEFGWEFWKRNGRKI